MSALQRHFYYNIFTDNPASETVTSCPDSHVLRRIRLIITLYNSHRHSSFNTNTCILIRVRSRRPNIDSRQMKCLCYLTILSGFIMEQFWNNDRITLRRFRSNTSAYRTVRNRLNARPFPVLIMVVVCRSTMRVLILLGYLFYAPVRHKRRDFGFIASDRAGCVWGLKIIIEKQLWWRADTGMG